ncbi:MAG TPA: hypothetical protein VGC41_16570, partial [Kofleriaceae bacterium]
ILGIDGTAHANQKLTVSVYFRVNERTSRGYKFMLAAWPIDPATWKPSDPTPSQIVKTPLRATADGFFPTDRWRDKELVRDKFELSIPDWKGAIAIGLVANDGTQKAVATGDAPANDPELLVLGTLPLAGP